MNTRAAKESRLTVVGLMSGTSGDGVDAAVVRISGTGHDLHVSPIAFRAYPYPRRLRERILTAAVRGTVTDVCHLNAVLGEWFARAALRIITHVGLNSSQVDLIGSHGQTIHHLPTPIPEAGLGRVRSTLQIAEPSIIAERTGITTVADFRPRDVAAGGQGAPLTPYVHHVLLRHPRRSRLIVNLGGIGNVTYLPAGGSLSAVRAFDTGPGNMVLDALMHRLSGGRQSMDRDGRMASQGTANPRLLEKLLAHPFLRRRPPKSTGREEFGEKFLAQMLSKKRGQDPPEDLLATASLFTAMSVGGARRWIQGAVDEVIVGGGGALNRTLMADLAAVFEPAPVKRLDDLGWESKGFEAIAFAVLAYQTVRGECGNVPSVTGAVHPVILGKLIPGRWNSGRKS
jgi:anhydro-N-acetylmuramic acid kinase